MGIIFDFKRQKKKKKKKKTKKKKKQKKNKTKQKKKRFQNFFFCQMFISYASTNTFMWSDGYQIIQERTTSIIIQSINLNPSYNDKNGWDNSREISCLVLKIRDVIS